MRLKREISGRLGWNQILLHDVVENVGFEQAPHMLLYHFNFGFPLLDAQTKIRFPEGSATPREPELPIKNLGDWQLPQAGFKERVYYHENLSIGADVTATVTVCNPHFPLAGKPLMVSVNWKVRNLPVLVQWKMPAEGTQVLGCNTSYPPRHFVVVSKLPTGGTYAQRSQRRIGCKAQASCT